MKVARVSGNMQEERRTDAGKNQKNARKAEEKRNNYPQNNRKKNQKMPTTNVHKSTQEIIQKET